MRFKKYSLFGMTLVELIIASVMLMAVFTMVMSSYVNFTSAKRKILLSSEIYNETRFLLERIVREVHNGTIDYQGYWRENLKNETAENWVYKTNYTTNPPIFEGVNEKGADIKGNQATDFGLNSIINCDDPNMPLNSSQGDTDTLEKQLDILYNYRYQFIYPGREANNKKTNSMVHLNCVTDRYDNTNVTTDDYNVYDDEKAYGHGPRAFDEETYADTRNSARASNMLWDWETKSKLDIGSTPNSAVTDSEHFLPPLLLVKANETFDEYVRTAIRYVDNKIKIIRFTGKDTFTDANPDFIPDEWKCALDFECGPDGGTSFNGTYLWSQKETEKNTSATPDEKKIGLDNGIGTITDSDLHWQDITPEKIEITSFDFILSPVKDPHRAFYEKDRIQKPQVTIIIEAQAKKSAMKGIKGEVPKIRLQTTATPRIWDLIQVDN